MRILAAVFVTASSDTAICNIALGLIGASRIANIEGTSKVERDCRSIYADARDEVLAGHHWAFARKQDSLVKLAEDPLFGFSAAWQLPNDHIKTMVVNGDKEIRFKDFGGALHCDLTEDVDIEYTARVTNVSKFSPSFVNLLAHRLTGPLAMMVKKDRNLSKDMWAMYKDMIEGAEADDTGDNLINEPQNRYYDARKR